jgi:ubiquinone/menaquinone biosynthesis C-methylase UbiE
MPIGDIPYKSPLKTFFLKIFGYPNLLRRLQAPLLFSFLNPKNNEIILDIGCSDGFFTYEIFKKSSIAIGIDIRLYENWKYIVEKKKENIYFINCNAEYLPFKSKIFDKILMSSVIQMIKNDRLIILNIYNILKKSGKLVLSVPIKYQYSKYLNIKKLYLNKLFGVEGEGYYTVDKISELLQNNGFQIIKKEYCPKKIGSIIYEKWLIICMCLRVNPFTPISFLIIYPIIIIDRFFNKQQIGDEIIIKSEKVVIVSLAK